MKLKIFLETKSNNKIEEIANLNLAKRNSNIFYLKYSYKIYGFPTFSRSAHCGQGI